MNTPSDYLFHLIKSLGKNEKKYFKNFASMHRSGEKNISVRLFDAINRQKKYDECKIICEFPYIFSPSRLPNEKNYLYQLILKSLRNYHAGSNPSINMQLNNILINIEILFEKTLYKQCIKLLKKAKKLAFENDKDLFHLEIYEWEKKLKIITQNYPNIKTERVEKSIFIRYYCNLLSLYNFRGDFDKSIEQIPKIEAGLKQFKIRLDKKHESALYLNMAYAYFAVNEYSNALAWITEILNDKEIDTRHDISSIARILKLIIYYELGLNDVSYYDSMDNLFRSTYRVLRQRGGIYSFESEVLKFFKCAIPNIFTNHDLISALKELKKAVIIYMKDPFERKALDYFDFISWIESKIEARPMREIIKQKLGLKDTAVSSLESVHHVK